MERRTVLAIVAHYLPATRAGGPAVSVANLVDALGDEFEFRILTKDRDLGSRHPYEGIVTNQWVPVGKALVRYLRPGVRSVFTMLKLLRDTPHDLVYLNSFLSRGFSIVPLLVYRTLASGRAPVLLAPRGEFSPGSFAIRRCRKLCYVSLAKALGLYRGVVWHATSELEKQHILGMFGRAGNCRVLTAPNLARVGSEAVDATRPLEKQPGRLSLVFLSRISRKKNLDGALSMLNELKGEIEFDVYGPIEDQGYWAECREIIERLPSNVTVRQLGDVSRDRVPQVFAAHHLFLFPTHGENFGHVICEALSSGCPVLISDQTPWRGLEEKGVGWDLPLDRPDRFRTALQTCVDMDQAAFDRLSARSRAYGLEIASSEEAVARSRALLLEAMAEPK